MKRVIALLAVMALASTPALAATNPLDDRDAAGSLREYIAGYLVRHGDAAFPMDPATKVRVVKTALGPRDPDGYVIYIESGGWCGSGGCTTLIVSQVDHRFQPLGFVAATMLPIAIQRPRGAADADLVATVRHDTPEGHGVAQATLTRRGDSYDSYFPQRSLSGDEPLEPLITNATAELTLY